MLSCQLHAGMSKACYDVEAAHKRQADHIQEIYSALRYLLVITERLVVMDEKRGLSAY